MPIAAVISLFQALAFRSLPPNPRRIASGIAFIIIGIACFRAGIDLSLIPMGSGLAERFARGVASPEESTLVNTLWLIAFAGCLGFAATMIEPTLTGVAERVRDLSGGALQPLTFRLVVAAGVAAGLALGSLRIVAGFPYLYLMVPLVLMIGVLALTAPRTLVPLSLDSGAMATSVVTVPIIAGRKADRVPHTDHCPWGRCSRNGPGFRACPQVSISEDPRCDRHPSDEVDPAYVAGALRASSPKSH